MVDGGADSGGGMAQAGRGWFLTLLAGALLLQAATAVARPLASYRALEIGMAPSELGLVAAAFAVAPVLLALTIGRQVDRLGAFPFLVASALGLAGSTAAIVVVGTPAALLGAIAVLGLSQLGYVVANQTLVGSRSHATAYDGRYGHLSFMASFGQLIGPAAAGVIVTAGGPNGLGIALGFGALLAIVALPFVARLWRTDPGSVTGPRTAPAVREPVLAILRMPGMAPAMLASLTVLATMDILVVYLPALGEERGFTVATVGALLAVRAGASMASRLWLGRLVRAVGRERLMVGSLAIAAASVVALPFLPLPAMVVAMAVAGLTLGVSQPMTMSWVAARASEHARGTAMSLRLLGNRLGQVAIPLAAGSVAVAAGTAGVLAVAGLTVALSALFTARHRPGP